MDDAGLVAAHLAGDTAAFAAIYDRYADRLHDFCHSVLRDRHEAADAVQDTMLVAHQRMHQLRDPGRLRPWLFSIARHESYRRTRSRARTTPTEDLALDMTADEAPPERTLGAEEASRVVWDAAAGLAPRDRIVLDLHVRQGLTGSDLAHALGVSAHHADVLVSRVRQRVERSLGALLVSRLGREDCDELRKLLRGWDGTFSVLMRKRVARHVDDCAVCDDTRTRVAGPVALLGAVPLVPAPAALRDRVLGEIERTAASGPGRPGSTNWHPPSLYRSRRRRTAACGTVAVAVAVALALVLTGGPEPERVALTTGTAGTTPSTTVGSEPGGAEDDGKEADPDEATPGVVGGVQGPDSTIGPEPDHDVAGTTVEDPTGPPSSPAAPGAPPGSAPSSAPGEPAPPPPGPSPPAPDTSAPPSGTDPPPPTSPPRLALSTSSIWLTPDRPAARITVRNSGEGPLDWSATSGTFDLSVGSGTLGPGQSASIEVTLREQAAEGTHDDGVRVTGAGQGRSVAVHVDRPPVIHRAAATPTTAACGSTVQVTAAVTDESPLSVRVTWTTPSGTGDVPLTRGADDTWTAQIRATSGPMTLRVVATDSRANSTRAGAGTVDVGPCRTPR